MRKQIVLAACATVLLLTAGCSGINASHSISPASFLLPGLLKAEPQPAPADLTLPPTATAQQVALLR